MGNFIANWQPRTRLGAFILGAIEFRLCCTWADPARDYDGEGESYTALDEAYDRGRDFAHRVTLRRFDD